jgi:hypothetical protein
VEAEGQAHGQWCSSRFGAMLLAGLSSEKKIYRQLTDDPSFKR